MIAGARKQADYDALGQVPGVEPVMLDVTKPDDVAALAERVRGTALQRPRQQRRLRDARAARGAPARRPARASSS